MTTYDPPQPNAALVIGPDDYLVLSFYPLTERLGAEFRANLSERYPAIADRILIVNAESMAALPPATAPAGVVPGDASASP